MRLLRVEVWDHGRFRGAHVAPNRPAADVFADHQRAHGYFAIVMFPRAEATR